MTAHETLNEKLNKQFIHRIGINDRGGLACYWARRSVMLPILMQKMKIHRKVKIPLFFGEKMSVITGEVVSSNLLGFGYSEVALTALMLKLITAGQNVVDVGAHFGYEALLASTLVGSTGTVMTFEPSPATYAIAARNLDKPNIKLHNKAVGAYDGMIKMVSKPVAESAFNSISDDESQGNLVEVEIVKLDSVMAAREKLIDFIKCDVEGFEMEVLKGAAGILTNDKPVLALEADMPSENTGRAGEIDEFLKTYGYTGYSFDLMDNKLIIAGLNSFAASHANILFVHPSKQHLILPNS